MRFHVLRTALAAACLLTIAALTLLRAQEADVAYLAWSAPQAEAAATSMKGKDKVGGTRGFARTDQAKSYKLRVQWLTPEVIRGTARALQLRQNLGEEQTRKLVKEAEAVGETVVMVELDPDEGSGVIPGDWTAILRPKGPAGEIRMSRGTNSPKLRNLPALNGIERRDFAYDRFWMVFRLATESGSPLFTEGDLEAELEVNIRGRTGQISWQIPDSIRQRKPAAAN